MNNPNPSDNGQPKLQIPVLDLSQLKKTGPGPAVQKPVMALTGTVVYADGTAQGIAFLAANAGGLKINIGNIMQATPQAQS